jgi:hypothetical protein
MTVSLLAFRLIIGVIGLNILWDNIMMVFSQIKTNPLAGGLFF